MSILTTCKDISALTDKAQKACNLFISECKTQGLNVLITETYRSQDRQDYLYSQGRTRPGKKVTWTKNSRHTSRRAWDICKNIKGEEYSDAEFFKKCGEIAKRLGIIWGGSWSTPDTPHFEISENWEYKGDDIDMEEIKKLQLSILELENKISKLSTSEMIYNYIDDNMPSWARPTVQKLKNKGLLKGNEKGELNLDGLMLRILVINDRTGMYD